MYSDAYLHKMQALADSLGIAERVDWLGYAGRAEMAWCFQHAIGFIMPSRLEACPNLVLEALANGAPSISTTCPPMPEMYGQAAQFYTAGDIDTLVARMEELANLTDAAREEQHRLARQRAESFSWARAAEGTLRELRRAAGVVV